MARTSTGVTLAGQGLGQALFEDGLALPWRDGPEVAQTTSGTRAGELQGQSGDRALSAPASRRRINTAAWEAKLEQNRPLLLWIATGRSLGSSDTRCSLPLRAVPAPDGVSVRDQRLFSRGPRSP
jgi:hypothetical protein